MAIYSGMNTIGVSDTSPNVSLTSYTLTNQPAQGEVFQYLLFGGNNISLSQSIVGSSGSLTINSPGSAWHGIFPGTDMGFTTVTTVFGNSSLNLQYISLAQPLIVSAAKPYMWGIGAASNSSGTVSITLQMGLYSLNNTSIATGVLSLISSGSASYSQTFSSNTIGTLNGLPMGLQQFTVPIGSTTALYQPGDYWLGLNVITNTANCPMSFSPIVAAPLMSASAINAMNFVSTSGSGAGIIPGHGVWTAASAALPVSINRTAISNTGTVIQFCEYLVELVGSSIL